MSRIESIEVSCSQLVLMRYSANGFANSFEYVLNALLRDKDEESILLIFDCDLKPVIVSNAFLAIELYLKLIYATAYYLEKEEKDGKTEFDKTHNLKHLYDRIPLCFKEKLCERFIENKVDIDKLAEYLDDKKASFEEWRYSFTANEDKLVFASDLKVIIDVLSDFSIDCINKLDFGEDWAKDIKTTSIGITGY